MSGRKGTVALDMLSTRGKFLPEEYHILYYVHSKSIPVCVVFIGSDAYLYHTDVTGKVPHLIRT